jgi:hypothetical protein
VIVGLIFECGPQGADKQVCEYLVQQLRPGTETRCRTLDNKENLFREAGKVAAQLLRDGCACVIVVWDLRPAWPDNEDFCRSAERQLLLSGFNDAGLAAGAPVYPVCIEYELESWLIANERALSAVLSTAAHTYDVPRERHPDRNRNPKASVIRHFRQARNWRYDDKFDAVRILRAAPLNLGRLRQSTSFSRFEMKLASCVCG